MSPYRVPFSHRRASTDEPTRAQWIRSRAFMSSALAKRSGETPVRDLHDVLSTRIEPARRQLDRGSAVGAGDAHEIVTAERLSLVGARSRSGSDADDRYVPVRPREIEVLVAVVVAVQDELGALLREHA